MFVYPLYVVSFQVPMLIDPNMAPELASEHGLSEGPDAVHCAEGLVVRDSAAILTYLALKYDEAKKYATIPSLHILKKLR